MALAFAGNGTITGLSVGGLPDGTVDEDTLANNAVGASKLASGAATQVIKGTVTATTSGTSVTFSSIPSGTKRIDIILNDVSDSGGAEFKVQIGDSGGLETSGYKLSSARLEAGSQGVSTSTDSFVIQMSNSGATINGVMGLYLLDSTNHIWVNSHSFAKSGTAAGVSGGGTKTLSAELTQLKFFIDSGSFDAGSVNIHYWA